MKEDKICKFCGLDMPDHKVKWCSDYCQREGNKINNLSTQDNSKDKVYSNTHDSIRKEIKKRDT